MRKLLLSAVALLALSAQNAFAINLTFQFDVNSSGPSIYACNAGIKHGSTGPNICFDRTRPAVSCTPGCAAGNMDACHSTTSNLYVEPKNCVCTGEFDTTETGTTTGTQGTYRLDFLQANSADWADNQNSITGDQSHILTADGVSTGQKFNQLFGTDTGIPDFTVASAYKKQLKDLTINLGSEVYGAEYFVDICYRGPQIDYSHNTATVNTLNFNLKAHATIFDIKQADNVSYNTLAGLQVKAEARCIVEDDFNYCLADILPGDSTGCSTTYTTVHDYTTVGLPGVTSAFQTISNGANVLKLINNLSISHNENKTPRFCQVRYSFKETNISAIRKWKLQQARVCTFTEITEPSAE